MRFTFVGIVALSASTAWGTVQWKSRDFSLPMACEGKTYVIDLETYVKKSSGSVPRFQATGTPEGFILDPATSILWAKVGTSHPGQYTFQMMVNDETTTDLANVSVEIAAKGDCLPRRHEEAL